MGEQDAKEDEKKDVLIELCEITMNDIKDFKVANEQPFFSLEASAMLYQNDCWCVESMDC